MKQIWLLVALIACKHDTTKGWTRGEWLTAVDGFARKPDTLTHSTLEQVVSTRAWLALDGATFEKDGEQLLRFFPAVKSLTLVLQQKAAVDDMTELGIYALDVYASFLHGGTEFINRLPADDTTRANRLDGLDKMRIGDAIQLCSLLYFAVDASEPLRAKALAKLGSVETYAATSREGMQLVAATLDEKILPAARAELKPRFQQVRDVVGREHDKRTEPPSVMQTTYQGMGAPGKLATITSSTAHFSVEVGPAALAKRVEVHAPDGTIGVQHWVSLQDGDLDYEALCFDGKTEDDLITGFSQMHGFGPYESKQPGKWFKVSDGGREARLRFTTIDGRGCIASVEAPTGQLPSAAVDAFLSSLRPS